MRIGLNLINSNTEPRGCDRYAMELVRALSEQSPQDTLVLFRAPWQTYLADAAGANVENVVLDAPRGLLARAVWQKFRFPAQARRHRLEVVHYTNPIPAPREPMPLLVTVHDVAEFSEPRKYGLIRSLAKRWFIREAITAARRVIVVSETTRAELLRFTPADPTRICVTPEGVSRGNAAAADRPDPLSGLALPERFCLYVGVTERTKQVELIIRAYARMGADIRREVGLVIAGRPGNGQGEVDRAIRDCDVAERVRLLGYVPDAVLWRLYQRAEAFVFPSLVEGFGLPVIEAMVAGLPVIAADIPVMREAAGDAALLVTSNDVTALADGMTRLCTDSTLRAQLALEGTRRSRRYDWAETARLTHRAYSYALGAGA